MQTCMILLDPSSYLLLSTPTENTSIKPALEPLGSSATSAVHCCWGVFKHLLAGLFWMHNRIYFAILLVVSDPTPHNMITQTTVQSAVWQYQVLKGPAQP